MAFIPTLNAIKVTIIGSIAGQQVVIDITIGTPGAVTMTDLENAAADVEDWFTNELIPILTNSYTASEIKAYDLTSASAPVVTNPVSLTGAVNSPPVSNNVALVTSFLTAGRGRSARGRNYLAGLQAAGGTPTSAQSSLAVDDAAAWAALNSYLDDDALEHIVISNYTDGAARAAGLKQPITGYRTNVDWDSQRRRLAGRGA